MDHDLLVSWIREGIECQLLSDAGSDPGRLEWRWILAEDDQSAVNISGEHFQLSVVRDIRNSGCRSDAQAIHDIGNKCKRIVQVIFNVAIKLQPRYIGSQYKIVLAVIIDILNAGLRVAEIVAGTFYTDLSERISDK
jgi:hypothetical protein